MNLTLRTTNYFALKLNFMRIAITALFIFFISITLLCFKQKKEIQKLKSEINQLGISIRKVENRIDDLESNID